MALPVTLGTESVGKLLRQYALPSIVAMTATSLYNMVDSIFIGQGVGSLALSGLTVTFPFMNLSAACGSIVGAGASTLISVKLGQKDYKTANRILGNVVTLNVIIGLIFMAISLAFIDPILTFFGASPHTLSYARDYMVIILLGNIITHIYFGLNAVLRSSGHPRFAMVTTMFTVLLNTALDPLFIFVFGWGIRGAAIATVLSQFVSLIWITALFLRKDEVIRFQRGIFKINRHITASSLTIGLPPFFINAANCLIIIFINKAMLQYGGDLAIASYGIFNRIVFLFVMITLGLTQGMQPIVGYNFGARQMDRVYRTLRLTIVVASLITLSGSLLCELIPGIIAGIFTTDQILIDNVVRGMRIGASCFWIAGFQIVSTNFFQSIGMPRQAIFISLSRQILFLLPGLIILPRFFGTDGVWLSMALADLLVAVLSSAYMFYYIRRFKRGKINFNL